jgi:E3 ubiquitin-protein ligase makorin
LQFCPHNFTTQNGPNLFHLLRKHSRKQPKVSPFSFFSYFRRFGLLVGCDHAFCLDCIRSWRKQAEAQSSSARCCPICRQPSHYIIPSNEFVTKEQKEVLDQLYKEKLKSISCKYFAKYQTCPFAENCFYSH